MSTLFLAVQMFSCNVLQSIMLNLVYNLSMNRSTNEQLLQIFVSYQNSRAGIGIARTSSASRKKLVWCKLWNIVIVESYFLNVVTNFFCPKWKNLNMEHITRNNGPIETRFRWTVYHTLGTGPFPSIMSDLTWDMRHVVQLFQFLQTSL